MKKIILLTVLGAILTLPIRLMASYGEKVSEYTWWHEPIDDCFTEIVGISPMPVGRLTVPASLDFNYGEGTLQGSVTSIRKGVFSGCSNLTSVVVPSATYYNIIEQGAFSKCANLERVSIGNYVTVESGAFSDCTNLIVVEVSPYAVVQGGAFCGCDKLTDFAVQDSNANGLILSQQGQQLVCGVNGNVTIPDSVTIIGENAFSGCRSLVSVRMSPNLYTIGEHSFSECIALSDISIPDSVHSIGAYSFSGCNSLKNVHIGESVDNIGEYAFKNCNAIEVLAIPASVMNIGRGAFSGCSGLNNVSVHKDNPVYVARNGLLLTKDESTLVHGLIASSQIPSGITGIGDSAYQDCSFLKSLEIPINVTNIGNQAFRNCDNLKSISIPDSVMRIGWAAFDGCSSLTNVVLPKSLTCIETSTFSGCSGLATITIPDTVRCISDIAFADCSSLAYLKIPSGVTNIGHQAFCNCNDLKRVYLPSKLNGKIDIDWVFQGCSRDIKIIYYDGDCPPTSTFTYTISDSGEATITGVSNITAVLEIPARIDGHPVTSLAPWSIYACFDLRSVTIPNTVTNIGEGVFSHCRSLEDIFVEDGNGAYKVVDGLLLSKDGSLLALVPGALGKLVVPESVRTIGHSACEGSSLTNVVFSTLVEHIEEAAFWACDIESIEIPDSVSSIGVGAFSSCHLLDSIYVGSGNSSYKTDGGLLLTKDGKSLIAVPAARSGVTVPEGVTNICESAFSTCNYLTNVSLPDSLIGIDAYAFECCWNITHIEIPGSVTFIGTNAFSHCNSLTNIVFNGDAPEMEGGVFEGLPEGCVAYVSQQSSGWNVEIPGMWNGVRIEYFDESHPPQLTYTYSVSDSGEATITGANRIPSVLEIPSAIDGHPVVAIGPKAFQGWVQVKEVVIPDSVKSIGAYAFQYCDGIERIVWGAGIADISQWAFSYCKKLSDVTFKYGLKTIAQYAFGYCEALETVTLPRSVEDIKWGAFASDPALETAYFHSNFRGKGSSGMFENSPNVAVYYYNCLTPGVPPPVENLSATTNGPRVIRVAWDFDSGVEVSAFKVYRASTDVFADAGLLAEVDSSEDVSGYEYDDYDVEEDTDYYYWVIPQNDIFEGEVSDFVVGSSFGPLEIDVSDMFYGVELVDFEQMLSVSDDRGSDNLEWMVDDYSSLPPGIEMFGNGVLSGVPIQHGTYTFTVRCQDWCFGVETTAEITVDIAENDNRKPVVSESSPADVTDVVLAGGATQLFSVSAADPDGQNIRYVWMVDGEEVLSGAKARTFLFDPSDYDDDPWGHEVICYVNDDLWENIVCRKWMVYMPQTLYVDAVNGDDENDGLTPEMSLASLEAVYRASPYSIISIAPGTYFGGLFLDVPVTIAAKDGGVVIDADGMEHCVRYYGGADFERRPVVRGCVLRNGYEAAAHVDLDRCVVIRNSKTWVPIDDSDPYYEVDESSDHGVLYDCTLSHCTIAGNTATPEHPLMVDCSYDGSTIVWGNNDENDELVDPVFVSLSNGDCRLRAASPYVANGAATRGALNDVVSGHVISVSVIGSGSLDKMVATVEDGGSATFSVAFGSHPFDHFEVNGKPVVASGNSYTFSNVSADAALTAFFVSNITFYVDATNGNDAADGFTKATAVSSLQTAIDRAVNGDMILVADGVYAPIETRNRRIVIESENGYRNAIIDGGHETNCALLGGPESFVEGEPVGYGELWQGTNTVLRGFTLRNGRSTFGGGVVGGILERCLVVNCLATLPEIDDYSQLEGWASPFGVGGGAYGSTLLYCTVVGNCAEYWDGNEYSVEGSGGEGGGVYGSTLENCIVYGNEGEITPDASSSEYSNDSLVGVDPLFANAANGDYRLMPNSPAVVDGIVVAGCETEIMSGTIPELTPAQAAAWVSEDLAARYAKSGERAVDYQSRFEAKFGDDPVAALSKMTGKKDAQGNNMYVWQDYVAGTDPTDTNSVFTATITMVDGAPVVEWSPKLGAEEEARRRYTIYGKAGLGAGEEWHSPTNALDRFFMVGVEMAD